ncbi:MAG: hypothetical protein HKN23_13245 [Verrucomicrobiales bacterium]|nr:hypothetical protein [Verrucomicrobiales bacterium]
MNRSFFRLFLVLPAVAGLVFFQTGCATNGSGEGGGDSAAKTQAEPYRYDKCLVINLPLDFHGRPIRKVYEGREVMLCCRPCVKTFYENPEIWMAKLDRLNAGTETFPHVTVPPPGFPGAPKKKS